MRFALILLLIGASMLSASALTCYTCSSCSETFIASENSVSTGCTSCGKYKYSGTTNVLRICASYCNPGTDRYGNYVYCCNSNYCNSAQQLRGFSWLLLLLPAAALAAICSKL